MVSPLPSAVVIECPKCGTRYQLAPDAIPARGRKVSCAHCGETWHAKAIRQVPDDDALFDENAEQALDEQFTAEEQALDIMADAEADPNEEARQKTIAEIKAAIAPKARPAPAITEVKPDPAGWKMRQKAFDQRQAALNRQLPLAKVRRAARLVTVSLLMTLIVCAVAFRTEIVRQFPDLAGAYGAIGLGVNVTGLEFRDVTTLMTLRGGANVVQVDGRIYSVASSTVVVPPVVVSLLDANGIKLYEWSVVPVARDLEPGEVVDFSTQLTAPPTGAASVRLAFTDGRARTETPVATATSTPSN